MGGKLVSNRQVQVFSGENQFYFDVMNMPPGAYIVRLENLVTGLARVAKLSVIR